VFSGFLYIFHFDKGSTSQKTKPVPKKSTMLITTRHRKLSIILTIGLISFVSLYTQAQNEVAIGSATTKANAILWLNGNGSQGLILPVVTNKSTVSNPDAGMIVYDNSDNKVWYRNNSAWVEVGGGGTGNTPVNLNLQLSGNQLSLRDGTTVLNSVPIAGGTQSNGAFLVFQGGAWQFATLSGDVTGANGTITITNNAVTAAKLADNAVTSAKILDATITGADIANNTITPNKLAQGGAANNQVLQWNGTAWVPATLATGGTVTNVTGTAPVTVTNPTTTPAISIANAGITTALIADNAITTAKIQDGTITGADIANTTVTADKLAQSSANNGQVLKWNGTAWAPAADDTGSGALPTLAAGQLVTSNGSTNIPVTMSGDATFTQTGALTIANNAVNSAKIADGSVTGADIAALTITSANIVDLSITANKLSASGATNNQVLQWNGSAWVPGTLAAGGSVTSIATGAGLTGGPITTTGTIAITAGGVDNTMLAANAVTTDKIADGTITGPDIANTTITANKLAQSAATPGQVLKWNGTNWLPSADDVGGGATPTLNPGQILIGDGTTNAAAALSGDATLAGGVLTIANNAITTAKINNNAVDATKLADNAVTTLKVANDAITSVKIADATITGADIANTTITADKLAASGATSNQVLQYNGTNWVPATLPAGGTVTNVTGTAPITVLNPTTTPAISIAAAGITNTLIADNAITNTKIADNAITSTKIAANAVTNTQLADNAVTTLKVANNAITSAKIADGEITNADIAGTAAIAVSKLAAGTDNQVLTTVSGVPTWQASGSGFSTLNEIPRGNGTGLVSSGIQSDGNAIAIGTIPDALFKLNINDTDGGTALLSGVSGAAATNRGILAASSGGTNFNYGADASAQGTGSINYGLRGLADSGTENYGVYGRVITGTGLSYGVYGTAISTGTNFGVYGTAGNGTSNWAGYFEGNTGIAGALSVGGTSNFGTAGQVLTSAGPGLPPSWSNPSGGSGWNLTGNTGTADGTNFIGTTDNVPLNLRVFNQRAGRIEAAGATANTFYGYQSGNVNTGNFNTAVGYQAMLNNTTGRDNVALGLQAMLINTTGYENTALGRLSLAANTIGFANTAVGSRALRFNTASDNTAVGTEALFNNATGGSNTAVGVLSLAQNTAASNTALGAFSMQTNTSGTNNVGVGANVLLGNTTGSQNTAFGSLAGRTTIPTNTNTTGSSNTFVGYASGPGTTTQLTNATAIGANAVVNQSNSLVLGSISGLNGAGANTNVGIGTATPNAPLQFANTTVNRKVVLYDINNNDHQYYGFGVNGGALRYQTDATAADHIFYAAASATASNELMRIRGSGQVLIPRSDWNGSGLTLQSLATSAGSSIRFTNPATGNRTYDIIGSTGTGASIGVGAFGIYDNTGGAYRFVINSAGNIGIGNLSTLYANSKLTIADGHIHSSQTTTPTIALNTASYGGTASINTRSTDTAGQFTFSVTTSGCAGCVIVTINFNRVYQNPPIVTLTPASLWASIRQNDFQFWVESTTTGFSIRSNVSPANSNSMTFNYMIIEVD
jgi:hypothetical protein